VKKIPKLVNIWRRYGQEFAAYFLAHSVHVADMIRYDRRV